MYDSGLGAVAIDELILEGGDDFYNLKDARGVALC